MAGLNENELREEYIRHLGTERFMVISLLKFLFLLLLSGSGVILFFALMILFLAPGFYKLLAIINLFFILFIIKRVREINQQIKDNQQN